MQEIQKKAVFNAVYSVYSQKKQGKGIESEEATTSNWELMAHQFKRDSGDISKPDIAM